MKRRSRILGTVMVLWALSSAGTAVRAKTLDYVLEIQNRVPVAYSLEIPVLYPGTVSVEADWECSRILTFKLAAEAEPSRTIRRAGPSPQHFELNLDEADLQAGRYYRLDISGLPAGGAGKGRLRIHVPDSPRAVRQRELAARPREPDPPEPEWWAVEAAAPRQASEALAGVYGAVESYRSMVMASPLQPAPDPCGWQTGLLQHFAGVRDRVGAGEHPPEEATIRYYRRIAKSVRSVAGLLGSADPILTGPPPEDRRDRNTWLRIRRDRIKGMEHELDLLLDMPRDGYVPELEGEDWPTRLVSCIMACQRNFEERGRTGSDHATNQDLAEGTWPAILAAAGAMEALEKLAVPDRITLR